MKLRVTVQKSQFSNSSVNWEKYEITTLANTQNSHFYKLPVLFSSSRQVENKHEGIQV